MQVKTFIYGTPFGFNFYEDDSQYKDYFKGFYISSREGRRLMVNRLDNGETTYNFLCYRITEHGNRPNAFFGMSLVLDDFMFCADFGNLYEWFNFLFDKLIKERKLFINKDAQLLYNVSKFEEDVGDVEWLKANLPNILSSHDIKLQKYDSSFSDKKTGKVVQFNNSEKSEVILKAFKQSRWISLSSSFGGDDCPELDFGELSQFLEAVTTQLLPIAISPEKKHLPLLQGILSEMKENYKNISDFVEKTQDEERRELFTELRSRYYDILANQLPQIAQKVEDKQPTTLPSFKICARCGKQKPLNDFTNGDHVCSECRAEEVVPHEETRICKTCGKKKPIAAFRAEDTICIECRNKETSGFKISAKYVYIGLSSVALIAIFVCTIIFWSSKERDREECPDDGNLIVSQVGIEKNKVQETTYNEFIAQNQFPEAFAYIRDKDDVDSYRIKLKDSYEKYLIHLDFENIQKELIRNSDLCEFVGVDFDSWVAYAGDGAEITTKYLNKTTISDSERSACKAKINNYKKGIYKDMALAWEKRLNEIPKTQQRHVEQQTIKVILYNADFAEVKRYEIKNTRVIEVQQFKVGGYVDVFCSNTPTCIRGEEGVEAKKQQGSKPPYRIKPINAGQWVYQCDDAQITIKTKKYGNM